MNNKTYDLTGNSKNNLAPIYEYDGARKRIVEKPSPFLVEGKLKNMIDYNSLIKLVKDNFVGKDVTAIYTLCSDNISLNKIKGAQHFRKMHFIRGTLAGIDAGGLSFEGPGGNSFNGVAYKGSAWLPPLDSVVDIVFSSSIFVMPHIPEKEYTFETAYNSDISDISSVVGKAEGRNALDAFIALTVDNENLASYLAQGSTFPVVLTSIKSLK